MAESTAPLLLSPHMRTLSWRSWWPDSPPRLRPLCRALCLAGLASWLNASTLAQTLVSVGKTLVVGSEQDFPPFALGYTDATADGFTVKLWQAVAQELGLKYTIRVRPFNELLQEFKDGKLDVMINLAQSDARREFADFTVTHVTVHGAVFVRQGESAIQTEADLAGRSIIVIKADLAQDYAIDRGWQR